MSSKTSELKCKWLGKISQFVFLKKHANLFLIMLIGEHSLGGSFSERQHSRLIKIMHMVGCFFLFFFFFAFYANNCILFRRKSMQMSSFLANVPWILRSFILQIQLYKYVARLSIAIQILSYIHFEPPGALWSVVGYGPACKNMSVVESNTHLHSGNMPDDFFCFEKVLEGITWFFVFLPFLSLLYRF